MPHQAPVVSDALTPIATGAAVAARDATRRWPLRLTAAALAYLVAALAITWPLARHFTTHLPLGTLDAPTVPWFNLWTLSWNADRWAHGLRGYWDAPIFYPARDTFALSEPQALTGAVFTLLRPLLGDVGAYNGIVIGTLVLNGLAARHVLRVSGVSARGASLGGLLAVASSFALKELGVLQLLALYGPLLCLAELRRIFRGEGGAVFVRLSLWCAVTLWSCVYLALMMLPLLAAIGVACALRGRLRLRPVSHVACALAIGAAALSPLWMVQQRAVGTHPRSAQTVRSGSASIQAYARLKPNTLGARIDPWLRGGASQRALFPGTALLLLAGLGLYAVRTHAREVRGWVLLSLGGCALACVLSFGNRWNVAGVSPYEWLLQGTLPGFAQLRSPYRFAAYAQLFLLVPAGLGIDALLRWRSRLPRYSALAALALLLLEPAIVPQPLERLPSEQIFADWVRFLRDQPAGAVAMIPPESSGRMEDYAPVALSMLQGLVHGKPLVGGYSGFFPDAAVRLSVRLRTFPAPDAIDALERAGVRYAVVDRDYLRHAGPGVPSSRLRLAHAGAQTVIYEVLATGEPAPRE